jgi:hydrogenase maturation protease
MKTLILGLGNPLLGDDAIGLLVAGHLRERLQGRDDVDVQEDETGGLRLMERLTGYQHAIIVDAIVSGGTPGTIRTLESGELPTQRTAIAHGIDLPRALELGRTLGLPMPSRVRVVAIEAASVLEFRHDMTPEVSAALDPAIDAVLDELGAMA